MKMEKDFIWQKGFHAIVEYDNPFDGHPLETIRLQLEIA